ncbi:glycoside hydrolase superfamily [Pyronema omphalodes]|nr:glycoside hydrolase superfamily [Pyronema omphalodes]
MGGLTDIQCYTILNNLKGFEQLIPVSWVFTFMMAEEIASLAKSNGQLLRGHILVWHSQLPHWVKNGEYDNSALVSILQNHVTRVATHYKGQWDVLNEIFLDNGSRRSSVFYNTIGESYVPIALRAARAADPNAKLYNYKYNTDGTGAKFLVMGLSTDGIGVQAHLISGSVSDTIQTHWAKFASLGVKVVLTEVDIRMTLPLTDAKLAQQAVDYKNVVGACVAVEGCIGIIFLGQGSALPRDENLVKKPAYAAIAAALA